MLHARLPRTEGSVRLGFVRAEGQTAVASLRQSGAARVRFPKPVAGDDPEAVLLNTAGGLTGGDRIDVEVALAARRHRHLGRVREDLSGARRRGRGAGAPRPG
jgi:urease accessory protein UreH